MFLLTVSAHSQSRDEQAIRKLLQRQTEAWNRGNIDEFMNGYWQNDSLQFIGKSGVTYGYSQTLANYKRNYSDTVKMGKLHFELVRLKRLSQNYYFVVGKWNLERTIGDIGGYYTLLFRKIKGSWVIVVDHTS